MARLWNIVSFLAVVNLLALVGFAGWLWTSGRLDAQRIHDIRDRFALTIAEETAAAKAESETELDTQLESAEREWAQNPSLPSDAQVRLASLVGRQTDQALRRLQDETGQLLARLNMRSAQLEQQKLEFEAAKTAWNESIEAERQRRTDEQFQKAVLQYESAPPKTAKEWILDLDALNERGQIVAYLDAMDPRAASKILREFKTEKEVALATELLEKLRTFGLGAAGLENSGYDDALADAQ